MEYEKMQSTIHMQYLRENKENQQNIINDGETVHTMDQLKKDQKTLTEEFFQYLEENFTNFFEWQFDNVSMTYEIRENEVAFTYTLGVNYIISNATDFEPCADAIELIEFEIESLQDILQWCQDEHEKKTNESLIKFFNTVLGKDDQA